MIKKFDFNYFHIMRNKFMFIAALSYSAHRRFHRVLFHRFLFSRTPHSSCASCIEELFNGCLWNEEITRLFMWLLPYFQGICRNSFQWVLKYLLKERRKGFLLLSIVRPANRGGCPACSSYRFLFSIRSCWFLTLPHFLGPSRPLSS